MGRSPAFRSRRQPGPIRACECIPSWRGPTLEKTAGRLHHQKVAAKSAVRDPLLDFLEITSHPRTDISVGDDRRTALELTVFLRQLVRGRNEMTREALPAKSPWRAARARDCDSSAETGLRSLQFFRRASAMPVGATLFVEWPLRLHRSPTAARRLRSDDRGAPKARAWRRTGCKRLAGLRGRSRRRHGNRGGD